MRSCRRPARLRRLCANPPHMPLAERDPAQPAPAPRIDEALSKKLRALSLLGIVMVVVGHAPSYRDPAAASDRTFAFAMAERLFTDALPRVVVMMFFAVSGFLYFVGHAGSAQDHRRKLVARTRSLLGPYLLWSMLGIALYAALQSLPWTAQWFSNSSRMLAGKPWNELARIWLFDPIPYQLWFLRDLWLMVVVSPLLLPLLRRFGAWVVVALFVPHALDYGVPSPGTTRLMTGDAYFWFTVGAWFAVRGLPVRFDAKWAWPWLVAVVALALGRSHVLADGDWPVDTPFAETPDLFWFKAVHLVGVPALWVCYDRWLRWMERPFWLGISAYAFFVFVAHEPLMTMLRKPLVRWLGAGDAMHALQFAITLCGTLMIVLGAGAALRRFLPRVFAFVCGGRGA